MSKPKPHQLAADLMRSWQAAGNYSRESIAGLADAAISGDAEVVREASDAIFGAIVEPLADCFEASGVSLYNRVFSQIVQRCREVEPELDRGLASFGIATETDLSDRATGLRPGRAGGPPAPESGSVGRVILLSRVTIGADVAVTSVLLNGLRRKYPDADFVLVGGGKLPELFGGDPALSFSRLDYIRAGALRERLLSWLDLVQLISGLATESGGGRCLIVDPDTRLTQLGLLPVGTGAGNYLFFPSREYGAGSEASLGLLASDWLRKVLGTVGDSSPLLHLTPENCADAAAQVARLRERRRGPVVTVNFGTGENPRKYVGEEFEQALVLHLLRHGATVILDKGIGQEEGARTERIARHAVHEDNSSTGLHVWSGSVGLLAALISQSDLYVGYDSAGQHIAAALGVPCIDIFAGYSSKRMMHRWRPTGTPEVILVDAEGGRTQRELLSEVAVHVQRIMEKLE